MSIEISVPVEILATLTFDVEPGTEVTQKLIDDAVADLNAAWGDGPFQGKMARASLFGEIVEDDRNLALTGYDRQTGAEWALDRGEAATPKLDELSIDPPPVPPKGDPQTYRVKLSQYVQEVATVEVEATSEFEARKLALDEDPDWQDGSGVEETKILEVRDSNDNVVWPTQQEAGR